MMHLDETEERSLFAARRRALPPAKLDVADVLARAKSRKGCPSLLRTMGREAKASRFVSQLGAVAAALAASFGLVHGLPEASDGVEAVAPSAVAPIEGDRGERALMCSAASPMACLSEPAAPSITMSDRSTEPPVTQSVAAPWCDPRVASE